MKNGFGKTLSLGIQHVLAMYAGAIVVPLIVGAALGLSPKELTYLVSIDIFMCGAATLLQVWSNKFFGIGLPVVLGCTFTAVSPIIAVGTEYGVSAVYGSIIASGLLVILISFFFGKLVAFFPPVVTGSVVTIIGITLMPVAMNNIAGGEGSADFGDASNLILGFIVLAVIVLLYRFTKGFLKSISILIGIVFGTGIAFFMGKVHFDNVAQADLFQMVQPFYFGAPSFHVAPIITMLIVAVVSLVESTGVYFALGDLTNRRLTEKDLAKGYRAEGVAVFLGGIFNAFPYTAYSQNVGLVQLTGIKKNAVIVVTGAMLMVLGLFPKVAAFTTIIPSAVLGGAMVAMFGMVIAYGIKMLSRIDFGTQENLLIVACSVGLGLGVTVVPDIFKQLPASITLLTTNGIVAGSFTAILLNIIYNMVPQTKKENSDLDIKQKTAV
ncbi:nucleobase:cation symporter-2 family protein [Bacillus atrophaeus]|uniref:xanthine permease PbuX n=1 Tax=Bacillus atrophaeus TaxID=1452 RepID=UPI002282B222|nr:nucleobase:cation symporter-2 family protein [Bacillus atrophaeus]MCY8909301.1 purine permease [Bacillus atrophaeus]MEC0837318.1 nucleobase:cation symporter-2 family protein [Bacillus atrophaeus]MEC0845715.1 nucleobase:cation symporter-2 family protein [Bacillus atrophaeus]MEC0851079.1 nucleobase:cation symporter-2 family protein [Bacillus atrophaeus]MEC0867230.1 nucleobase:cation symporter-2 family protein [Bacillus atrophaeus]